MNTKKQKQLLNILVSDDSLFAKCINILDPDYFDPELKPTVSFISDYYNRYNSLASIDVIDAETDIKLKTYLITKDEIDYCADEIEQFCRYKAIENAVLSAPALIKKGDYGKMESAIREAISVGLEKDLGVDYFTSMEERIALMKISEKPISTGWVNFDQLTDGGLLKKTLTLLSANSGGGKSIAMSNMSKNFASQGLSVLYISLELSENLIAKRFDSIIGDVDQAMWALGTDQIIENVKAKEDQYGALNIKYMAVGSSGNDIRAYLKEFELKHKHIPDVLIVDYLDLMAPNEKISADNVFEKDKLTTEQLRSIVNDFDMIGITASQQNRSAVDLLELNHSHIAGGISKINTVDNYISIVMTDKMKLEGVMVLQFLKTRSSDGVGKNAHMRWIGKRLTIEDDLSAGCSFKSGPAVDIPDDQEWSSPKKTPKKKASLDGFFKEK